MYIGRFGKDAASGALPPLYLGYANLVRGYEALDFAEPNTNGGKQPLSINDLVGSQMYVGNVEIRFPLTGPERLAGIKSRFLFSDLNLFTDGGIAWGNYEGYYNSSNGRSPAESKFIFSSGISLRVNLFGYLVLEPFFAIPWQNGGFRNLNFGLNLLPGW
jgi:outer membrane protein assembly factor BamA